MLRRYPGTDHVTGLRAYSAMLVVMIHMGAFRDLGAIGRNVTDAGRYGVIMFFVISGFSVTASYFKSGSYAEYIVRRLARIWPLYVACIAVYAGAIQAGWIPRPFWMERFGAQIDVYNIAMHVTFLSFLDYRIASSIMGVEWSIPVEVLWYVLLPVFFGRWYGWRVLVAAALALLAAGAIVRLGLAQVLGKNGGVAAHWLPVRHGAYFLLGVLAYKLREEMPAEGAVAAFAPLAALAAIALAMATGLGIAGEIMALATAAIIATFRQSASVAGWAIVNRPALLVGTVSYSIYLLHLLVHQGAEAVLGDRLAPTGLATFAIVALATIGVSTATYLLIERPTNRLGAVLGARLGRGGAPVGEAERAR